MLEIYNALDRYCLEHNLDLEIEYINDKEVSVIDLDTEESYSINLNKLLR
jgi:hypothetical protein